MKNEEKKPRRGRPTTVGGDYSAPRQLGRVSDEEWSILQEAAKASGKSFTRWAVEILLKAAKKGAK